MSEQAFLSLRPMSSNPEVNYPGREPSSLQLFIKFYYKFQIKKIHISDDDTQTTFYQTTLGPVADFVWSDIGLFSNNRQALHDLLSSTLARLGVDSCHHASLISMAFEKVATVVTNSEFEDVKVLPLLFDIMVLRTCYLRGMAAEDRVVRESRLEHERQNYGMLPTARESRILKRVKVESCDSEICSICFEEIVDFAASMPCAHLFHSNCILEWLKMSHYCPLCRFKMPTET